MPQDASLGELPSITNRIEFVLGRQDGVCTLHGKLPLCDVVPHFVLPALGPEVQKILNADELKTDRIACVILVAVLSSVATALRGCERLSSGTCTKNNDSLLASPHDARIAIDDAELEEQLGRESFAFRL